MPDDAPRHHRHHKDHRVRPGKQIHGGDGSLHDEGKGLQLPVYGFSPIPGVPRISYPKGWTFKRNTAGGNAILLVGCILVLLGIALALLRLFGG
ncbi:MAG TPA: hypothetical protein VJO13_03225 [Ktedonobacterales bacterium]|nr:hypothetical protein [Ktedonobacterales bacterium]